MLRARGAGAAPGPGLEFPGPILYHAPVKTRRSIARLAALAVVMACSGVASAQSSARPPIPSATDKPPLFTYLMAVVVGVIVVGGNLIPSKRGHQD